MNPFKTIPALFTVYLEARKYVANISAFKKLRSEGKIEEERALILQGEKRWIEAVSAKLNLTYEIKGEENIPEQGPVMIYSNHQSFADIFSALYLMRNHFQIGFVAKSEWKKIKILADAIEYTRSVFLVRDSGREAIRSIQQASDYLKLGFSLLIYPEGTRSKSGKMGDFKAGAFKFAQKGKVPILPITVDGGYKMFEEKGTFQPCNIKITVHPLVPFDKMNRKEQAEAAIQIEESIKSALENNF
ncbi:MAG TPA: 1-acyl-sn-glycerol-3-phosphate acyltransferase [Mogibacterium sp.]|nr:1-acyl-sn-glycerol-3-phosphate acyltransferase [Mogibacterium sp.]